jgi:hypothetical protein
MAFAVIAEIPGGTLEQYDAVAEAMGFTGAEEISRDLLVHFAGVENGTLVVVDLWESREAYQRHLAALGEKGREGVRKVGLPAYTHREFEVPRLVRPRAPVA